MASETRPETAAGPRVTPEVDPAELYENGYVIVRQVIPPDQLDPLRAAFEMQFEKQRVLEASRREPDSPPERWWENSRQRRVYPERTVDEMSASVIDFLLGTPLEVSRRVLRAPRASLFIFNSLNNPLYEHGPDPWHRDPSSARVAPLEGLVLDLVENGAPAQVQWNVPLYDDPTLWVVPGSHRRLNTPEEDGHLREHPREPMPGGVPVELKAGDGVVYPNLILHWGSYYTPRRLRRTFHFGYRAFGGPMFPYYPLRTWGLDFTRHCSPAARSAFEQFYAWHTAELEDVAAAFRAVVEGSATGFETALARLHPGEKGRMVAATLLDRFAQRLRPWADPAFAGRPVGDRAAALGGDEVQLAQYEEVARRLSPAEVASLLKRFAPLDERLREGGAYGDAMPAGFGLREFVAGWG